MCICVSFDKYFVKIKEIIINKMSLEQNFGLYESYIIFIILYLTTINDFCFYPSKTYA